MNSTVCPKCRHTNSGGRRVCERCGHRLPTAAKPRSWSSRREGTPKPQEPATLQRGDTVAGRYTVTSMIGRGGMGCIYLVQDNVLKEHVALKTLLPQFTRDKMVVERFHNEARIARQLSHPNIVRVHDIGVADDAFYISMEYVQGKSLRGALDDLMPGDRLPVLAALRIMDQLCAALEYAHQRTIHRDIKPENVMILDDDSVKLMDFGISKLMSSTSLTTTSVVMGTPHYMSPEQHKDSASVDARSDIFSLGVMLYEILSGNVPTGAYKPASQLRREVPPMLDPIVAKCLDPDPNKRYQSAKELRDALSSLLQLLESGADTRGAGAERATVSREGTGTSPVRKAIGIVLAALVVLIAGLGLWQLGNPLVSQGSSPGDDGQATPAAFPILNELRAEWTALSEEAKRVAAGASERFAVFEAAKARWAFAEDAERSGDSEKAWRVGCRAVQRLERAIDAWAGDMVFIRQGDAGFFIDNNPVTLAEFAAFDAAEGWRGTTATGFSAGAVNGVRFYDALAYAAWAEKKLPSLAQYDAYHNHLVQTASRLPQEDTSNEDAASQDAEPAPPPVNLFYEWTRTRYGAGVEEGTDISWGRDVTKVGLPIPGSGTPATQPGLLPIAPARFESSESNLGFRCVIEIP